MEDPCDEPVNYLIDVLNKINNLDLKINEYDILNSNRIKDISGEALELINEAEALGNEVLIIDGKCNWDNHTILKDNGFNVFPGERDRFGWLTGCIQTKKGIIMFG